MFSSIFRPSPSRRRIRTDSPSFISGYRDDVSRRHRDRDGNRFGHRSPEEVSDEEHTDEDDSASERDERQDSSDEEMPLLPMFDSTVLDTLPVYMLTHTVRLLVSERCETVLSWEQLRSPQISQFLLKPIQQEIRTNHFSAATVYALIANCLQFTKEIDTNPGNSGTCKTRAMICELLAIKLLREYTTRGLVDALSYDFDPLQGHVDMIVPSAPDSRANWRRSRSNMPRSARISCLEIAIRAQAKRFLAHPLVVQQLQAIWNGTIVFHSAADSLHRGNVTPNYLAYGSTGQPSSSVQRKNVATLARPRKLVTLYNPQDASIFKLSRLRVPRYRNLLSTISFAVLLGLFVAVLTERSLEITSLEVIFWFWAAGYMLDEVVTFNEQGFSLYIASFWNTFDLGILLLLVIHFCLRIYGLLTPTAHKRTTANMAYDLLAADAILLFPRLFSVLDHYRYFSQLIIAFRMMAADLLAVFILIVIACSGFFVALSLSFGQDSPDDPKSIGFALLQLLLGFTPAAWDRWELYTPLGRGILILYMCITHFVVVTILVSVLTNSFMAVVQNANEEHQFLFAVNTISSVKSDSLFSYIPPLNVLQWLLYPTSFFLPFRKFIQWNRVVIKLTHLPVLLAIYVYERIILRPSGVDSIDLIENRASGRALTHRFPRLVKEPSKMNFRQDQALEQVFKQPFDETLKTTFNPVQRQSSTVVSRWMNDMDAETAAPPEEQDQKIVNRLERRRPSRRNVLMYSKNRNFSRRTMSVASDPAEATSHAGFFSHRGRVTHNVDTIMSQVGDADGDDELLTNDVDEDDRITTDPRQLVETTAQQPPTNDMSYSRLSPRVVSKPPVSIASAGTKHVLTIPTDTDTPSLVVPRRRSRLNVRNSSYATMIFNPAKEQTEAEVPDPGIQQNQSLNPSAVTSGSGTPRSKQASESTGRKTPKRKAARVIRPIMPDKRDPAFHSTPNLEGIGGAPSPQGVRRSSLEMDLVSDIGDNKALGGGYIGALPASMVTQMAYGKDALRQLERERKEEQERMSRLMMARMNSLEEGFRGVIHEMRESMKPKSTTETKQSRNNEKGQRLLVDIQRERKKGKESTKVEKGPSSNAGSDEGSSRPDTAIPGREQNLFPSPTAAEATEGKTVPDADTGDGDAEKK